VRFERAYIPLGGAWSTPFARWQGALGELSSLELAERATRRALADRGLPAQELDRLILGWTVPQPGAFYGAPTVAARIGAPEASGPMVAQACATSAVAVELAASRVEVGADALTLALLTDRTSNGPHLVYPAPSARGGAPRTEDWVLESFRRDPWAGDPMVRTAEKVASEGGFSREEADEVTLLRHEQYAAALADDRAFQRRYLVPVEVPRRRGEGEPLEADSGVHETTAEGLRGLEPTLDGGVITAGSQTHPADGAAGVLVTTEARARELGRDGGVVRLLASGSARAGKGLMPKAPVPAAQRALADADLDFGDLDLVTTHNPFAINDLWFSRETGIDVERMNPYGCSLVYGHPQAPTGARALAELIEALAERGGGTGLFTGCAAGDTGAALVVRVED
jgi:acetyl-CoA acetyltransferase family protein